MNHAKKRRILEQLAAAITKVVGTGSEKPVVLGREKGFDEPTLCWEGVYEWTAAITGGNSLFAGETGNYSTACEKPIADVLRKYREFVFEPLNNCQLCVYE